MNKQDLHIIAVISNPANFKSRYRLYREFEQRMLNDGANLYTVELAIGNQEFAVTDSNNPKHTQLRTNDELWHKENLINIAISNLPSDAKYVAWIDADVQFLRPDWIEGTLEELQVHPVVQMWSEALDLGPKNEILKVNTSLAYCYRESLKIGEDYGEYWHSGYAWAATMDFLRAVGGLVDATLVGAADHQMAMALAGRVERGVHGQSHANLKQLVYDWGKRAEEFGKDNLGYVKGGLLHYWHGAKKARKYVERWSIVVNNKFDPLLDIKKNDAGLYEFSSDKPKLREDMKEYFRQRDEDGTET